MFRLSFVPDINGKHLLLYQITRGVTFVISRMFLLEEFKVFTTVVLAENVEVT